MRCEAGLAAAVLFCAAACTTDQPKGSVVADAGAPPPASMDAGAAAALAAADAGVAPPVVDAGAPPQAGELGALGSEPSPGPTPDAPERPPAAAAKSTVFDRLLAKPKERGADPQAIKALIERRTGLKVELARRTAGSWVLIQLVAAPGGRTAQDQRRAIEELERLGTFATVEGDRLMKVKTP